MLFPTARLVYLSSAPLGYYSCSALLGYHSSSPHLTAAAGKSAEDVAKEIEQRHRDIGYGEREEEAEDALASVAAGERDIVERQVRQCGAVCGTLFFLSRTLLQSIRCALDASGCSPACTGLPRRFELQPCAALCSHATAFLSLQPPGCPAARLSVLNFRPFACPFACLSPCLSLNLHLLVCPSLHPCPACRPTYPTCGTRACG